MAHKMVRQPSETPNISNIDDIVPFRYAYGNQDGYVINKGSELSYTINGSELRINSGRVVLQGVEDDIDANGISFTIDNIGTTRYFVIYYRVNLANNITSYEITYDTAGYPIIDAGDDLTKNSSGIANLPIYRFTAIGGVISNVEKVAKPIEYSGTALVGYDIDKGTVEERLTRLGFRQDNIIIDNTSTQGFYKPINEVYNAEVNSIKRQGNYVIGNLKLVWDTSKGYPNPFVSNEYRTIGIIPENFRPTKDINIGVIADVNIGTHTASDELLVVKTYCLGVINTQGEIKINPIVNETNTTQNDTVESISMLEFIELNFGYETYPII